MFVQASVPTGSDVAICNVTVRYRNRGDVSVGNVTPDGRGLCILRFNVPDEENAVGGAGVFVTVFGTANQVTGQGTRGFIVRP